MLLIQASIEVHCISLINSNQQKLQFQQHFIVDAMFLFPTKYSLPCLVFPTPHRTRKNTWTIFYSSITDNFLCSSACDIMLPMSKVIFFSLLYLTSLMRWLNKKKTVIMCSFINKKNFPTLICEYKNFFESCHTKEYLAKTFLCRMTSYVYRLTSV